jgi:hypothetical protein
VRIRLLAPTLVLTAFAVTGCNTGIPVDIPGLSGSRVPDRQQIVRVLDDVANAMESRRIYRVLAHVSQNYQDREGRNYDGIQAYLNTVFRRYRFIEITRVPPDIVVQGDRARALETFGSRATPFDANEHPPLDLDGNVVVHLVRQDNTWKIVEWAAVQ